MEPPEVPSLQGSVRSDCPGLDGAEEADRRVCPSVGRVVELGLARRPAEPQTERCQARGQQHE